MHMKRYVTGLLMLGAIAVPVLTHTASLNTGAPAQAQAGGVPAPAGMPTDIDKSLRDYRADVQVRRADLLSKNITLSAAEAAKFWPLYEKFQQEQSAIIDAQLKGTQDYVANYDKLDGPKSIAFLNTMLSRDESMIALRKKYLPLFQQVVSTQMAVRVIQIDRRVSLLAQVELSGMLPLVR
jgi:hypothetical protein